MRLMTEAQFAAAIREAEMRARLMERIARQCVIHDANADECPVCEGLGRISITRRITPDDWRSPR